MVAASNPDAATARESLATLCAAYWYPIYAYIRHRGYSPDQAQDLAQDFFAGWWRRACSRADPRRGRFRSFLRTVCVHYLANRRDRQKARKRSGGRSLVSIDGSDAETRCTSEPAHELTPERIFDWTWALTLISRVLDQLRWEYEESGRARYLE